MLAQAQVDYFKSSLDAALLDTLWNKYWVNTLAASPLLATRPLGTGQLTDVGAVVCREQCMWFPFLHVLFCRCAVHQPTFNCGAFICWEVK